MRPDIVSAETWGRRLRGVPTPLDRSLIDGLVVHYLGTRTGPAGESFDAVAGHVRGVQDHHLNSKGAGWVTIAYNFLVDKSGRIWEGRGLDFINGANRPANRTTVSVCLLNGVDDNPPTPEQLEAVRRIRFWLSGEFGKPLRITGHRDHSATACPGDAIYAAVQRGEFDRDPAQKEPPAGMHLVDWPTATIFQAFEWARSKKAAPRFSEVIVALYRAADVQRVTHGEAIDPAVAVAQAAKETGWGRFSGVLGPERHNTAGIKIEAGGGNFDPDAHESFESWDEGARAQLNHLGAYAGIPPVGIPHPRHATVMRLEWAGNIRTVEELGARWAPSASYGRDIVAMVQELRAVVATPGKPATPPKQDPAKALDVEPVTHVVQRGESWWRLAETYYGDGSRWPEIADRNGRVALHPGMTVLIP